MRWSIENKRVRWALIILSSLLLSPHLVHSHPEELVQSFQSKENDKKAMPVDADLYGEPLWEIDAKVPFIGSPVHEKMTIASINLSGVHGRKYKLAYDEAYIHGVFWNDDPEDLLCPECSAGNLLRFNKAWGVTFATRFRAAESLARPADGKAPKFFTNGDALLDRSHFGDMQFLHGMASRDGEPAAETQAKILKWAEFVYKIAIREISQKGKLSDIPIPEVAGLFKGDPKLESATIEQLFLGPTYAKRVLIGTLLHMVQDSFASGHAEREILGPESGGTKVFARGRIREFHSYTNQDSGLHAKDDKWPEGLNGSAADADTDPISIGAKLLRFIYANEGEGTSWNEVESYLHTVVFGITDKNTLAGPGERYRRK